MSILNRNVPDDAIFPIEMPFGKAMEEISFIPAPTATVAALNERILLCGDTEGCLALYTIDAQGKAGEISALEIGGLLRQISVCGDFAYISARDGGAVICDLSNPAKPKIAAQIDTLELATGIAAADGLLAITDRHLGCELYDVRDPYQPRRIGSFLCGEAQSVFLYKNYALISHWVGREAAIFDISDPTNPKKLSDLPADGFADGVCIVERKGRTICMIGAGHHATRLVNRNKYNNFTYVTAEMIAEGYGCGHGVAFYDITDPQNPKHLSTLKTPPHFCGTDTWLTYSDGDTCIFTDSMNGVFAIDLETLTFKGHYRLAPCEPKISRPAIQVQSPAITDAAVVGGYLCVAARTEGVYILKPNQPLGAFVPCSASVVLDAQAPQKDAFYASEGAIHSFIEVDGKIYCASGTCGIEVLDRGGNLLLRKETQGICHDICLHQGKIYTAEGNFGVGCYDFELNERSRASLTGCVRQLIEAGEDLLAQVGSKRIVRLLTKEGGLTLSPCEAKAAPLYHRHLSRTLAGNYAVALPLANGPALLDTENNLKKVAVFGTNACPFEDGACGYQEKLRLLFRGKYHCLDNPLDLAEKPQGIQVEGAFLKGIPQVVGDTLVILNRYYGTVELLDISDPHRPQFMRRIETESTPEFCGLIGGELYLCLGYDGMIKL